jgi:hypothetical protein
MMKTVATGIIAILVAASPCAYAQSPSMHMSDSSAADAKALTEVRISVIKAALQLKPEQEKLWPAVEQAIRFRAKDRQERLAKIKARIEEMHERNPGDFVGKGDPVAFLNWRASALAQRAAGLKKLADAWEPLYKTLAPDQKERMRFAMMFLIEEVKDAVGQAAMGHGGEFEDE